MEKNIFSFIRDSVDIVSVISEYVLLKRHGNYWKGLSPFRSEKTASFTVTPDKKIYYCFSTGVGGDVVNFISRVENCNQYESVFILSKKYNIKIPKEFFNKGYEVSEKEIHIKSCELFMNWTKENLLKNRKAIDYLNDRKISDISIKRFNIGYCPSMNFYVNEFIKLAKNENILISNLIESGILNEKKDKIDLKKKYYFPYEERIIFPIMNNFGLCIGFSGRIFKNNEIRCKYLNSFTNKEFSKKEILYGLNLAKKSIQKEKFVYLVEGYFDVIGFFQSGFENVIATMGTACNEEHINLIEKICSELVIVYDGDFAGQEAILKLINLSWKSSLDLKIVKLPEFEDPDSLSRKNLLKIFLDKKEDAVSFYIKIKTKNFLDLKFKEKLSIIFDLIDSVALIKDEIKRSLIISNLSKKFEISEKLIEKELKKVKSKISLDSKEIFYENSKEKIFLKKNKIDSIWFFFILSCILNLKENFDKIKFYFDSFDKEDIPVIYKDLWYNYIKYVEKENNYDYLVFFNTIDSKLKDKLLWAISIYQFSFNHLEIFYRELKKIKLKFVLKSFENDSYYLNNDLNNYFSDISNLYKKKKEIDEKK